MVGSNLATSGEDLVDIGLMADIPDDLVFGSIVEIMQRDSQLDRAERRGENVPPDFADAIDDVMTNLAAKLLELLGSERLQIGGRVDARPRSSGTRLLSVFFKFDVAPFGSFKFVIPNEVENLLFRSPIQ